VSVNVNSKLRLCAASASVMCRKPTCKALSFSLAFAFDEERTGMRAIRRCADIGLTCTTLKLVIDTRTLQPSSLSTTSGPSTIVPGGPSTTPRPAHSTRESIRRGEVRSSTSSPASIVLQTSISLICPPRFLSHPPFSIVISSSDRDLPIKSVFLQRAVFRRCSRGQQTSYCIRLLCF
jgi:hypothetical protein